MKLKAQRRYLVRGAFATAAIFAVIFLVACQGNHSMTDSVPLLILDTDISSDVDDVGAVALLHGLANQGRVQIAAMMVSSADPWSVSCLDALNTWFGRPDIPIGMVSMISGVSRGQSITDESKYTRIIAEEFPHDSPSTHPGAVALYRKILSQAEDQSVTLVSIGYLTNLGHLLKSQADAHSDLDGITLVRAKVEKLICMGGQYPSGREWNFYQDSPSSIQVVASWPTPIVFSGFEIGKDLLTGTALKDAAPDNPIRRSYELYNNLTDRPSWDQVAVYYGVMTVDNKKTGLWSRVFGENIVQPDGSNYWLNKRVPNREHSYLVQLGKTARIAALFEQLMLTTPR